ncbi:MAG: Na/Pi cotransporter family protein [Bacteroidales bacterium]|nr:Na/Pi cotransporter family protein [Candidatus Liminaster caballi]
MAQYSWIDLLTLAGSIGLFLYGMRMMSDGLQKIAGDRLRNILAAMTTNRFTGMLTGILVTALVQSSSATTVMIVSFVNAGLITLSESMAVIMGANVGTTVTTWIIALCGFKFSITPFILPLIAISLPFINSNNSRRNSWGEFMIGFALLFMGLEILKQSVPDLSAQPAVLQFLQDSGSMGALSVLLFLVVGIVMTMIIQASSAAFTLAVLACSSGWITFEMGCALVLGSNIGTCITPLLASISANTMAKRAAAGHLLFNVIGTVWALVLYYPFCRFIIWLCVELGLGNPSDIDNVSLGMTMFHTVFNIVNLILMLGLTRQFVQIVTRIIPESKSQNEAFKLQYIDKGGIVSGEMALIQVRKEIHKYAEETHHMFGHVQTMLSESLGSERQLSLYMTVRQLEDDSDHAEMEIADFLNQISPKTLSHSSELEARRMYKVVDELESIADSIYHIACTLKNKYDQRIFFNDEINQNVSKMVALTDDVLVHMLRCLERDEMTESLLNKAYNYEDELNNFQSQIRNGMLESVDKQKIKYEQSTYYIDIINECEKVGDYVINVLTALYES